MFQTSNDQTVGTSDVNMEQVYFETLSCLTNDTLDIKVEPYKDTSNVNVEQEHFQTLSCLTSDTLDIKTDSEQFQTSTGLLNDFNHRSNIKIEPALFETSICLTNETADINIEPEILEMSSNCLTNEIPGIKMEPGQFEVSFCLTNNIKYIKIDPGQFEASSSLTNEIQDIKIEPGQFEASACLTNEIQDIKIEPEIYPQMSILNSFEAKNDKLESQPGLFQNSVCLASFTPVIRKDAESYQSPVYLCKPLSSLVTSDQNKIIKLSVQDGLRKILPKTKDYKKSDIFTHMDHARKGDNSQNSSTKNSLSFDYFTVLKDKCEVDPVQVVIENVETGSVENWNQTFTENEKGEGEKDRALNQSDIEGCVANLPYLKYVGDHIYFDNHSDKTQLNKSNVVDFNLSSDEDLLFPPSCSCRTLDTKPCHICFQNARKLISHDHPYAAFGISNQFSEVSAGNHNTNTRTEFENRNELKNMEAFTLEMQKSNNEVKSVQNLRDFSERFEKTNSGAFYLCNDKPKKYVKSDNNIITSSKRQPSNAMKNLNVVKGASTSSGTVNNMIYISPDIVDAAEYLKHQSASNSFLKPFETLSTQIGKSKAVLHPVSTNSYDSERGKNIHSFVLQKKSFTVVQPKRNGKFVIEDKFKDMEKVVESERLETGERLVESDNKTKSCKCQTHKKQGNFKNYTGKKDISEKKDKKNGSDYNNIVSTADDNMIESIRNCPDNFNVYTNTDLKHDLTEGALSEKSSKEKPVPDFEQNFKVQKTDTEFQEEYFQQCQQVFNLICKTDQSINRSVSTYVCKICGKICMTGRFLESHMLSHTTDVTFICCFCTESFMNIKDLEKHEFTHKTDKAHICCTCGKEFKFPKLLKEHEFTHKTDKAHICYTCGKEFKCPKRLKAHEITHRKDRPFVCGTCGNGFKCMVHLKNHSFIHMPHTLTQCRICGAKFSCKKYLRRHVINHLQNPMSRKLCKLCHKWYPDITGLLVHMNTHSGSDHFTCYFCELEFGAPQNLLEHMTTHYSINKN